MSVPTKIIDLEPLKQQIEDVSAAMKNPLPTPPVGTTVVWYDRAEAKPESQIAGLVTKVEGPGKVTLTVFRAQGMPDPTRRGCLHISHSVHEQRHNAVSRNSGAWDYPDGVSIPKAHYTPHLDLLETKKMALQTSLAEAQEIKQSQEGKGKTTS